jgi:hypothetical protein
MEQGTDTTVLARFRLTRRQALARRLHLGALAGAGMAVAMGVPLAVRHLGGATNPRPLLVVWLAATLLPVVIGLGVGPFGSRTGTDVDDAGIRPGPGAEPDIPWEKVVDVRAERYGRRTVVMLHLDSGQIHRLRAPYDGCLLAHDRQFECKLFALRNLWETHRRWPLT